MSSILCLLFLYENILWKGTNKANRSHFKWNWTLLKAYQLLICQAWVLKWFNQIQSAYWIKQNTQLVENLKQHLFSLSVALVTHTCIMHTCIRGICCLAWCPLQLHLSVNLASADRSHVDGLSSCVRVLEHLASFFFHCFFLILFFFHGKLWIE